jgi:hypothetical protein
MNKKLLALLSAVAATMSVTVVAPSSASASKPTITAGPGSSVHCDIAATGTFTPSGKNKPKIALKNDWAHALHSGLAADPGFNPKTGTTGDAGVIAAVAAIPDTAFASRALLTETDKGASLDCAGTATDGVHTAPVTGAKFVTTRTLFNGDNSDQCLLLADGGDGSFSQVISWVTTDTTVKIAATKISGFVNNVSDGHGLGYEFAADLFPTYVNGSFAGAVADTKAYLDASTGPTFLNGLAGPTVTSSNAANIATLNPCEPQLKVSIPSGAPPVATIKAGKGINTLGFGPAGISLGGPGDGTPSTLTIHYR